MILCYLLHAVTIASYVTFSRDTEHENTNLGSDNQLEPKSTFSEDKIIPIQFTVKMPPPRYYPVILERDKMGRIITSKFPEVI